MRAEAIFHSDRDCAAERVQAEQRTGGHDVDAVDGNIRKQVPVDRVAESLIDAHAILVYRQTLRGAQCGRGLEAAIQNIGLERIGERVVGINTANVGA